LLRKLVVAPIAAVAALAGLAIGENLNKPANQAGQISIGSDNNVLLPNRGMIAWRDNTGNWKWNNNPPESNYPILGNFNGMTVTSDGTMYIYFNQGKVLKIVDGQGGYRVAQFADNGTQEGYRYNFYCPGTVLSDNPFQQRSDIRFKTDVRTLTGCLEKVKQLRPVSYAYGKERRIGLIGQEVKQVLPEVVKTGDFEGTRDMHTIGYTDLIPVLVEAVKELKAEVDQLREENMKLKR
jgi:hypothetical protein